MNNNNYYLCQWRDTTTDPPMSDWTGHAKTHEGIKFPARIVNGMIYMFGAHTSRVFPCQPGDQWLDVTDEPAVSRAKVQAAVDEMASHIRPLNDGTLTESGQVFEVCVDIITTHTGVTPTEEPHD